MREGAALSLAYGSRASRCVCCCKPRLHKSAATTQPAALGARLRGTLGPNCTMSLQCQQRMQLGSRARSVRVNALFGRKASTAVVEKPSKAASPKQTTKEKPAPKKQSFMSQTLNAFDFAEVRSKRDAELLYEAKYGPRGEDGKMTREQYAALRRKIGGTARDYWKDWVEEEQVKNIKTYYKPGESASVPFLPFLVGVVLAMLAATVVVVQQTS